VDVVAGGLICIQAKSDDQDAGSLSRASPVSVVEVINFVVVVVGCLKKQQKVSKR
jgi:hypothetical protein